MRSGSHVEYSTTRKTQELMGDEIIMVTSKQTQKKKNKSEVN